MSADFFRKVLLFCSLGLFAVAAIAQVYPTRPIRIVVPYAAGGGADFVARIYAKSLSEGLGQQIVVENRAGANGNIGAEFVAKARPDGYTLLLSSVSTLSANMSLYAKLAFDVQKDFSPVGVVASQPNVLVVSPSIPVNTVEQLVALAKAKPGQLTFGSAGTGSGPHLSGELFKMATGVQIVHVPYKGAGPATGDLVGGHISLMFNNLPPSLPLVAAGKLKALAVTSTKRSAAIPDVPTMAEAGYPSVEMTIVNALFAPAETPATIISRLNAEIVKASQNLEVQKRLEAEGNEAATSTPAQLTNMLKTDAEKWSKVIKAAGIAPE